MQIQRDSRSPRAALALAALVPSLVLAACAGTKPSSETTGATEGEHRPTRLFLDVHRVGPGEVALADVAEAHAKDLAIQDDHGVDYRRYWVDEDTGTIYCLVAAPSAEAAERVHHDAHGLLADEIVEVRPGILPAEPRGGARLFLDTHVAGPGEVTYDDVAEAHRADLAVQHAHGVNFLSYWIDEQSGRIHCLAEAPSAEAFVETHRDAHGLLPDVLHEVVEGD